MRTVVFLGLMQIAIAINPDSLPKNQGSLQIIGFVLLVAMIMDVVDFFRGKK